VTANGDVAVGALRENNLAGVVDVFYGHASGLTGTGTQNWSQDSSGVPGTAEAGDEFGATVRLRDTNGDGRADLVVGVPGESSGGHTANGAVSTFLGAAAGLTGTGSAFLDGSGLAGGAGDHMNMGGEIG
jgi:hypothetical protein